MPPISQDEWNNEFVSRLKEKPEVKTDQLLARLLSDYATLRFVAMWIRKYVDQNLMESNYRERRERRKLKESELQDALKPIEALLRRPEIDKELASKLEELTAAEKTNVSKAFSVKRHGRDRSLVPLYMCYLTVERNLGVKPPFGSLATLANIAFEVEGSEKLVSEENVRKNLRNFKANNPELVKLAQMIVQRWR